MKQRRNVMPQTPKAPWLKYFGDIPEHLVYPQGSMYEAIKDNVNQLNKINSVAYEFQGKKTVWRSLQQPYYSKE